MLVVLYGKTGSGKSTIAKELGRRYGYKRAVTMTSRSPRKGEIDGVHYYFKSREEMEKLFYELHELAELNSYMGNYYGFPISELTTNDIKIAVLEPDGVKALIAGRYDILPIYISISDSDQRLFLTNDMARYPDDTKKRLEDGDSKFTEEVISLAGNNIVTNSSNKNLADICNEIVEIIKRKEEIKNGD